MFSPFHGFVDKISTKNEKNNVVDTNTLEKKPQSNLLNITIPDTYFEKRKIQELPITTIPPNVIPKESKKESKKESQKKDFKGDRNNRGDKPDFKGDKSDFKGDRNDRGNKPDFKGDKPDFKGDRNDRGKRFGSYISARDQARGREFDKSRNQHELQKYKYDDDENKVSKKKSKRRSFKSSYSDNIDELSEKVIKKFRVAEAEELSETENNVEPQEPIKVIKPQVIPRETKENSPTQDPKSNNKPIEEFKQEPKANNKPIEELKQEPNSNVKPPEQPKQEPNSNVKQSEKPKQEPKQEFKQELNVNLKQSEKPKQEPKDNIKPSEKPKDNIKPSEKPRQEPNVNVKPFEKPSEKPKQEPNVNVKPFEKSSEKPKQEPNVDVKLSEKPKQEPKMEPKQEPKMEPKQEPNDKPQDKPGNEIVKYDGSSDKEILDKDILKEKYNKLKRAYVVKHYELVKVFNGYRNLYQKAFLGENQEQKDIYWNKMKEIRDLLQKCQNDMKHSNSNASLNQHDDGVIKKIESNAEFSDGKDVDDTYLQKHNQLMNIYKAYQILYNKVANMGKLRYKSEITRNQLDTMIKDQQTVVNNLTQMQSNLLQAGILEKDELVDSFAPRDVPLQQYNNQFMTQLKKVADRGKMNLTPYQQNKIQTIIKNDVQGDTKKLNQIKILKNQNP
jgi:hypothetical protein